ASRTGHRGRVRLSMNKAAESTNEASAEAPASLPRDAKRNVLVTFVGRVASVGINLLATLWIIRYLGPDQYGTYLIVFTVVALVDLTVEASLFTIVVREIAKSKERAAEWVGAATWVRGAVGVVLGGGMLLVPLFVHLEAEAAATLRVGALVLLLNSFRTPVTYFRAVLMVHWELIFLTLTRALELGLIILIARLAGGIAALMGSKALASALFVTAVWLTLWWRFRLPLRSGRSLVRPLLLLTAPLALTAVLIVVQTRTDILLIGWFLGPTAAGAYGAVAQVPDLGAATSGVLMTTVAPLLARSLGKGDTVQFQAVFQRIFDNLVTLIPGGAVGGCRLADPLVRPAFGEKYAMVVPQFRVLVCLAAIIPVADLMGVTAVTLNLQGQLLKVEVVSVLATLCGNLLFLGLVGTIASAWIRLLVYFFGMVLLYVIIAAHSPYRLALPRL